MSELDAYFDRIGWGGSTEPTLATLSGLLRAHMRAIPFENLDVLLGRPISLDLGDLRRKLVHDRRGGYCFEHVTLFAAVLEAIGFTATRHLARVTLFVPSHEAPLTHMFLVVALAEGRFVVDPGFGGPAALFPMPLDDAGPAQTHRMQFVDGAWVLRTPTGNAWASTLASAIPIDFEVSNHFTATHRSSPFVNWLMMSRFTDGGRVSVMNRNVTIRSGDTLQTFELADRAALRRLLREAFGFDLPAADEIAVPEIEDWK